MPRDKNVVTRLRAKVKWLCGQVHVVILIVSLLNWPLPAASPNFGSLGKVSFPFHFQAFSIGGLYFTDCM